MYGTLEVALNMLEKLVQKSKYHLIKWQSSSLKSIAIFETIRKCDLSYVRSVFLTTSSNVTSE